MAKQHDVNFEETSNDALQHSVITLLQSQKPTLEMKQAIDMLIGQENEDPMDYVSLNRAKTVTEIFNNIRNGEAKTPQTIILRKAVENLDALSAKSPKTQMEMYLQEMEENNPKKQRISL